MVKIFLYTDGTKIGIKESKLLGTILTSLPNDDDELDIGNKTYEELQIILGQTPKTSYLSTGLEQRLRARKQ